MRFKDELQKYIYYKSQIDYCYYMLEAIINNKQPDKSPINMLIDKATGFDKELLKREKENIQYLVSVMIRCKTKIGHETENDKKFLKEIKKLMV